MSGNSEVLKIAQEWIEKAENDLKNAVFTLKMRDIDHNNHRYASGRSEIY